MSNFTSTSKSLKNSISLEEKNYESFKHKSNLGIKNDLNNIHPFNLETTFGRVITDKNNEYEISFTCNDEESKCTDNTNKKILDFLERKEFILMMIIFQNVKQIIFLSQNQRKNYLKRKKELLEIMNLMILKII